MPLTVGQSAFETHIVRHVKLGDGPGSFKPTILLQTGTCIVDGQAYRCHGHVSISCLKCVGALLLLVAVLLEIISKSSQGWVKS